jgi:hypothetical protein
MIGRTPIIRRAMDMMSGSMGVLARSLLMLIHYPPLNSERMMVIGILTSSIG